MSWPLAKLESIAEKVDYGLTASAVEADGPRFLRITDLQNDSVDWKTVPSCVCSSNELEQYRLLDGDIVFARTGATTGKSYRLEKTPENSVFASYLIRVRPKSKVSSRYLGHFFKSPNYWHQISKMANGAAQPGVNSSKLKDLVVPVPPLADQKRIAAILDKADAIRRKRQQAIELADQFLRSVFLDLFGDPLRWDVDNPKRGWAVKPIEEIAHLKRGYDLPVQSRIEGEVPVFAANGVVGYHDTAKANGPGVVTGRSGTLGSVQYAETGFWPLNTTLYVTDFHRNEPKYIEWFLRMYKLDRFHRGAGVPTLNRNLFLKELSLVPPAHLQEKFVAILRKTLMLKASLEDASKVRLFESLSQKAFAGQL